MSMTMPRAALWILLVLLVHLSLAHSLSLGRLEERGQGVDEGRMEEEAAKRDGRRITRGRYRMGYMFGKRSDLKETTASILIKSLIGKAMSVEEVRTALQTDPAFAERVARHLDSNGDGYVSVSELL